ncbi:hypothetical protein HYH03_001572 [Edaphochlamys debaryana]|uniref:Uncharacterized protein n=1 Tax=Edaphochlamys debaryana TaxID=47281 RepID=A0A835YLM8_9CHLO|nr:hypothetical protein HYH03_001572 [Edaphochlamys debaryana]|eukprot:KAG2500810.1 hypothetical protein HYH03_001572 [Edaphochlamys debaryana]
MDLLAAGYGSGSDDEQQNVGAAAKTSPVAGKPQAVPRPPRRVDSDSDSAESSEESVDSATLRAAEAAARLRDYGEPAVTSKAAPKSLLPSALDLLDSVEGPPTFLDPEAIRPLASASLHGLSEEELARMAGPGPGAGGKARQAPGRDFDVSKLAPPLKGQAKQHPDQRDAPPGAVIEGRAKRYRAEDGPEATQQYTAAQIAMMGGKVAAPKEGAKPMEVNEFLAKGHGAAKLPRKNEDRKDKEKEKRMKGQSTHSHWKSEAEMVLRQQFDS